jgi:hypothetical protein
MSIFLFGLHFDTQRSITNNESLEALLKQLEVCSFCYKEGIDMVYPRRHCSCWSGGERGRSPRTRYKTCDDSVESSKHAMLGASAAETYDVVTESS